MATILTGRNSRIALGTTTVAELGEFSLTIDAPFIETEPFGSTNTNIAGVGLMGASGSFSGSYCSDDTAGQEAIKTAFLASSGINNFRIYVSDTQYWCSDTDNDSDATCYFSNFSTSATSNEVVKLSFDFKFSGKIKEVTS